MVHLPSVSIPYMIFDFDLSSFPNRVVSLGIWGLQLHRPPPQKKNLNAHLFLDILIVKMYQKLPDLEPEPLKKKKKRNRNRYRYFIKVRIHRIKSPHHIRDPLTDCPQGLSIEFWRPNIIKVLPDPRDQCNWRTSGICVWPGETKEEEEPRWVDRGRDDRVVMGRTTVSGFGRRTWKRKFISTAVDSRFNETLPRKTFSSTCLSSPFGSFFIHTHPHTCIVHVYTRLQLPPPPHTRPPPSR